MTIVPITLKAANQFILQHHRHNKPATGCKFTMAVKIHNKIVAVAICGRPTSRHLDDHFTLEISRLCTDGTHNAQSFLLSRIKRCAQLLGYTRLTTVILSIESGGSLAAVHFPFSNILKARNWKYFNQPRDSSQKAYLYSKKRYTINL